MADANLRYLPTESRIEVLFPVITTLGVLLRLGLRHEYNISLLWDDALIVLALLFSWSHWISWYWMTTNMLNSAAKILDPSAPALLKKLCMAMDIFAGEGVNIVKFAMLMFFLRAFGSDPNAKRVRLGLYILMGIVAAYTVVRAVETVLMCPPICFGKFDNRFNDAALEFSMRAINWLTEIVILLFPIPILWRMTIPTKKKFGIAICFLLGGATCAASATRLYEATKLYIAQTDLAEKAFSGSPVDETAWFLGYWVPQMSRMTLWSFAELNIGILTATLPAIRSPALALMKSAVGKFRGDKELKGNSATAQQPAYSLDSAVSKETSLSDEKDLDSKNGIQVSVSQMV